MSPGTVSPLVGVKGLAFDVFGTVVNWRLSVTDELVLRAYRKLSSPTHADLRSRLESLKEDDWARFAQLWKDTYGEFTNSFVKGQSEWKTVDAHYRDSLIKLLDEWGLTGLFNDGEIESLSLVWHRLEGWDDSSDGLRRLRKSYQTATLSNGNLSLLRDLQDFSDLPFDHLLSAETFHVYKPDPDTYLGAARTMGLEPGQVAMVAAHLGDLEAAKSCGLRTIYVERDGEEEWKPDEDRYQEAKGWVDLWIDQDERGFVAMANKLNTLMTT